MGWILGPFAVLVTGWWITRTVLSARLVGHPPDAELTAYLARSAAVGTLARVAGVIITLTFLVIPPVDTPARSPLSAMATLIAAPVVIVILVVGDRRWPAPSGTVRTASLAVRRPRDTVPAAELCLAVTSTVILWVESAVTAGEGGTITSTGVRITTDALSLVAITIALVAIRRVTTRAPLIGVDGPTDLAFRRSTCGRVLRTLAAAFLLATAGSIEPLLINSGVSSEIGSALLLAGALIALFPLQGRHPRPTTSPSKVKVEPHS